MHHRFAFSHRSSASLTTFVFIKQTNNTKKEIIILESLVERFPDVGIISGDESRAENKSVSSAGDYPPPRVPRIPQEVILLLSCVFPTRFEARPSICMRASGSGDSITSGSRESDHLAFGDGEAAFWEYSIRLSLHYEGRDVNLQKAGKRSKWNKVSHLCRFTEGACWKK